MIKENKEAKKVKKAEKAEKLTNMSKNDGMNSMVSNFSRQMSIAHHQILDPNRLAA